MKIAVIDDYQDAFRMLRCYPKLEGHEVLVYNDTEKDPARLAVAEHPGHRLADVHNPAVGVDQDHDLGAVLDQRLEALLAGPQLRGTG
mgnify:CR=1 FL=1